MTADAWLTLAVAVGVLAVLITERVTPAVAMLGGVTLLLVTDVIDTQAALSGFANPAPVTVAALYVLAGAVDATGLIDPVLERAMARGRSGVVRILAPTAAASAFLNNTPIVAMVAPRVAAWARRRGQAPSRFLMPLSFAAVVGGLVTVMGTSTNVVVSGLLSSSGREPLGFFEIGAVGLPLAVVSLVALATLAPRLLPERRSAADDLRDPREFTVEMLVIEDGALAGKTVSQAALRNLEGVFLVEIERDGRIIAPVPPDEVLESCDRLTFAGNVNRVLDLQRLPGLESASERHFSSDARGPGPRFFEVVIAPGSSLQGRTLKQVGFRGRFGAAVVAVHRSGERVPGKLGDVALRAGDVLLALGPSDFSSRSHDHHEFLVVSPTDTIPVRRGRSWIVGAVAVALVASVAAGVLGLLEASLLAAGALVVSGVLSAREAREAVDIDVIVLLAASFGLGAAIEISGLATIVGDGFVDAFGSLGDIGLLAGVLLGTIALTELITNNAAAVLMFPIAMATATSAGLEPRGFAIAVAVGASASFLTPLGYQTNTMVYGMGGYRFGDFARLGGPLTVLTVAVTLAIIPVAWPL